MISGIAPAKINLALVVGGTRDDGLHEVATILQRVELHDTISIEPAAALAVEGFEADSLVRRAVELVAADAGIEPNWRVRIEKRIPVAAGLGGGSSDAGTAIRLACELIDSAPSAESLRSIARSLGVDVAFFLKPGPQLGLGDGSILEAVDLPQDYWILLLRPHGASKPSTGEVYGSFDGADGFDDRRALVKEIAAAGRLADLAALPRNDLAWSPLSARVRELGAFRADVSGAGPVIYGLFADRRAAESAAAQAAGLGETWLTAPAW